MINNPQGDWKMESLERIAGHVGITVTKPKRGSHYGFNSENLEGILTVPYKRPIKAKYIKDFVAYIEAHIETGEQK